MTNIDYLFVYGSLRKGHAPPEIAPTADKLELAGEGFVFASLYDLGAFRAIKLGSSAQKVFGQVLEVPAGENIWPALDEYEGFDTENPAQSLFVRARTTAFVDDREFEVWIYEYNRDVSNYPLIEEQN